MLIPSSLFLQIILSLHLQLITFFLNVLKLLADPLWYSTWLRNMQSIILQQCRYLLNF